MGQEGFHSYSSPQHGLLFHFPVKDESCPTSGNLHQAQHNNKTDNDECGSRRNTDFVLF